MDLLDRDMVDDGEAKIRSGIEDLNLSENMCIDNDKESREVLKKEDKESREVLKVEDEDEEESVFQLADVDKLEVESQVYSELEPKYFHVVDKQYARRLRRLRFPNRLPSSHKKAIELGIDRNGRGFPYHLKRRISDEEFEIYRKQCQASHGFDVPYIPDVCVPAMIKPVNFTKSSTAKFIAKLSMLAITHYNKNHDGANYVFSRIEKANCQAARGLLYYITFKAKDAVDSNHIVTFEAKVLDGLGDVRVWLCRIKRDEQRLLGDSAAGAMCEARLNA